jgi:hypothetical protein
MVRRAEQFPSLWKAGGDFCRASFLGGVVKKKGPRTVSPGAGPYHRMVGGTGKPTDSVTARYCSNKPYCSFVIMCNMCSDTIA